MFGVLRRWTCLRCTSTRSFPCTALSSRIPKPSSRMRSYIRGTGWTCMLFLPFPWSGGLRLKSETPNLSMTLVATLLPEKGWFADPTTSGATPVGPAASAAPLQPLPPGRPRAEPSHMATLKRLLQKSGFSRGAALELSSCVQESTARLYQAEWLSFCGWCCGRDIAPVNATILLIMDFFIHLHRDKGLSVSAIKGYQATLNSVLPLKGLDLSTSRELSIAVQEFLEVCSSWGATASRLGRRSCLQSLTGPPYEPPRMVDEHFLAHKMLFLLARGLRSSLYPPYLSQALILPLDSYVWCEWSGVTWPALSAMRARCLSPQDVSRRSLRTRSPSGCGR